MIKYLISVLMVVIIFSCDKPEKKRQIKSEKNLLKSTIIIINSDTTDLFLRDLPSLKSPKNPVIRIQSGKQKHHFLESKLFKISSANNFSQEVLIEQGDTLNISFKENKILLDGTFYPLDSITYQNEKIDKLKRTITQLNDSYFVQTVMGESSFIIKNEFEKILASNKGGGFYDKKKITEEIDSISVLMDYELKLKNEKINYVNNYLDHFNESSKNLLKNKITAEYYANINKWLPYLDENVLITGIQNQLNASVLENKFAYAIFHNALTVLQNKYSSRTKTKQKTRFYSLYDELPTYFSDTILHTSKSICLDKMISWNEPWVQIEKRYKDYKNNYGNDDLIADFVLKNKKKLQNETTDNKFLQLADGSDNLTNLKDILNKGKPVYVDFWASWCAPCIANMPFSKEVEEQLQDKVYFIFVSIDLDENSWLNSSEKLNLPSERSFIAINYESSEFISQYNIKEIPRYMIFDKDGNLYNDKALTPKDQELYYELLQLTQ
jgi:thiol-disulfide isomerase/thioredoxin